MKKTVTAYSRRSSLKHSSGVNSWVCAEREWNGITSNGAHYNLNLIGVTNGKSAPLTGSDRHTIFVPLYTNGKRRPRRGSCSWHRHLADARSFCSL